MSTKNGNNFLELYNFTYKKFHYFEAINATYWDTENIISKKYKKIKENEESEKNNEEKMNIVEEAYNNLLNNNNKSEYYKYLMLEYSLSQPNNIEELVNEYYSIIFPYYLFLLNNESNEDLLYCIIDYINLTINIYDKNGKKSSLEINSISDINVKLGSILIETVNANQKITLTPKIIHHLEILYLLLIYMALIKKKIESYQKEIKKVNEINQNLIKKDIETIQEKISGNNSYFNELDITKFKLITNDSFVPKGILASLHISFEHNKKAPDRFLLLGRRYIYLFKNESLKELNAIIPLSVGFTIIEFIDDFQKIELKAGFTYYNLFIYERNNYEEFKEKLVDIIEGNLDNIFEKDDIFKCSKAIYDDKVLGGVLENTPIFDKNKKEVEMMNKKLKEISKIKNEIEKECFTNENIRKQIEEEEEKDD